MSIIGSSVQTSATIVSNQSKKKFDLNILAFSENARTRYLELRDVVQSRIKDGVANDYGDVFVRYEAPRKVQEVYQTFVEISEREQGDVQQEALRIVKQFERAAKKSHIKLPRAAPKGRNTPENGIDQPDSSKKCTPEQLLSPSRPDRCVIKIN